MDRPRLKRWVAGGLSAILGAQAGCFDPVKDEDGQVHWVYNGEKTADVVKTLAVVGVAAVGGMAGVSGDSGAQAATMALRGGMLLNNMANSPQKQEHNSQSRRAIENAGNVLAGKTFDHPFLHQEVDPTRPSQWTMFPEYVDDPYMKWHFPSRDQFPRTTQIGIRRVMAPFDKIKPEESIRIYRKSEIQRVPGTLVCWSEFYQKTEDGHYVPLKRIDKRFSNKEKHAAQGPTEVIFSPQSYLEETEALSTIPLKFIIGKRDPGRVYEIGVKLIIEDRTTSSRKKSEEFVELTIPSLNRPIEELEVKVDGKEAYPARVFVNINRANTLARENGLAPKINPDGTLPIRVVSNLGIAPLQVQYQTAAEADSYYLWLLGTEEDKREGRLGQPISNGVSGKKTIEKPGRYYLNVVGTDVDGNERRGEKVITVLERVSASR